MKRIAITGGEGFIGRHVVEMAENDGHEVVTFDRSKGDDILGDLTSLTRNRVNVVIHLAGMLGTSELFDDAEKAVRVNVMGTLRILQWCEQNNAQYVGITMPDSNWANVYQATKLASMKLATAWNKNFGVPVSHVRAFNAYGEGQKHGPGHPQKFLPTFATKAWAGEPLPIWGSGNQTVDAVDVVDLARMLVDAMDYGNDEVFDGGTAEAVPVIAVATYVNGITGNNAGFEFLPMRPGESPNTQIVARGAGWDKLGWHPELKWNRIRQVVESYRPKEN